MVQWSSPGGSTIVFQRVLLDNTHLSDKGASASLFIPIKIGCLPKQWGKEENVSFVYR